MPLIVKICGLTTPDTLDAALDAGADMVGFVFFPPSPRHLTPDAARVLGDRVEGRAAKVALTVDADDTLLAAIVDHLQPNILQLHGRETPQRVTDIRARFSVPVMKMIPVATREDLHAIEDYRGIADRFLFDARAPKEATRPGGLGMAFDWTLLRGVDSGSAAMLSGGLHAGNVAEAVRVTGIGGVDVSSGVESAPGVKDVTKIRDFIRAARATDAFFPKAKSA